MPRPNPSFAHRLRELREAADMTQSELARQSGVSRQALSKLELGEREPTWETVRELALALGVGVAAFDRDDPPGPSPTRLLEAAQAYGRAYDRLEQKSRNALAGSVEGFARFQEAQVELNLAALDLFAARPAAVDGKRPARRPVRSR